MAETLDYFFAGVVTQDTKKRIETGEELIAYLQNLKAPVQCDNMDKFVDGLAVWVNSSSFKVSLLGLDVLLQLIDKMRGSFKSHVTSVLSAVIDRLGDSKDQVRESAKTVLLKLMDPGSTPQYVAERLTPGFSHKLWKVKEETLTCLQRALNEWGAKNFVLSKLVPHVIKLLDDPSGPVREQAIVTLVEFYKHVGEKIRTDLSKRDINPSKLSMIFAKMDDARNQGLMYVSESDDMDSSVQPVTTKKTRSSSSGRCQSVGPRHNASSLSNQEKGLAAGALDQEGFLKSFEDVPRIYVSSGRDVTERLLKIKDTLSDMNKDWEKRQDALKELRSLVVGGATNHPEFQQGLRSCEPSLRTSVLDLRSQVVREACITLAYLSQEMGRDFEHASEILVPALVQLLQNSAKIMASSGYVALKFIIQNTHSHRLIPLVTCNLTSKSNIIRRQCCELIEQMLRVWPVIVLEKQASTLQDAIRKGLADADLETKVHSRRAYWNFEEHFKVQASSIFSGLDPSQQKHLTAAQGGSGSSSSSSTGSVNMSANVYRTLPGKSKIRSVSGDRLKTLASSSRLPQSNARQTNLPQRVNAGMDSSNGRGDNMPRSSSTANLSATSTSKIARPISGSSSNNANNFHSLRHSHSSSDLSTPAKKPPTSKPLRRNASMRLPRSTASRVPTTEARYRKSPNPSPSTSLAGGSDVALGRPNKIGSSSQPSSRSVSPSSRFGYISQQPQQHNSTSFSGESFAFPQTAGAYRYGKVGLREPSPSRADVSDSKRRKSAAPVRVPINSSNWTTNDLDNVKRRSGNVGKPPRRYEGDRESIPDDLGSETSSLCSDRSFNLEGDMSPVINGLLSGSWTERKDSLLYLQSFFQSHRYLSQAELKRVSDAFNRFFYDQNAKVFSLFLDTLVHFISAHKMELGPWIHVCLPMLLNKLGSETHPTVQNKIQKVLDNIRVFFPGDVQFLILTKFIVDQMKSVDIGVKLAVLGYLHELTLTMTSDDLVNTTDVRLAITRIITCSTEPKSPEVRKASTIVFIRLHQLNPDCFRSMLDALPKSFQVSGNRILQENSYSFNRDDGIKASSATRVVPSPSPSPVMYDFDSDRHRSPISNRVPIRSSASDSENINPSSINHDVTLQMTARRSVGSIGSSSPMVQLGNKPSLRAGMETFSPKMYDPVKRDNYLNDDDLLRNGSHDCTISKSLLVTDKDIFSEAFSFHHLEMTTDEHDDDDDDDDDAEPARPDEIDKIIQELAHKNERGHERKLKLVHLIMIAQNKESVVVWEHHSKTILMLLLETLDDELDDIKEIALKALVELVYNHMQRFIGHAELILSSVIEARRDASAEVAATAQDSALVIASLFPVNLSISIILPFIAGSDPPTRLVAFRIQLSIVETINDRQQMRDLLPSIMPGILKGYEDGLSAIRKDSVFTLVKIYILVEGDLKPYLKDLSNSKVKLLNLYIKRALVYKKTPEDLIS